MLVRLAASTTIVSRSLGHDDPLEADVWLGTVDGAKDDPAEGDEPETPSAEGVPAHAVSKPSAPNNGRRHHVLTMR